MTRRKASKRGPACSICAHERRASIDIGLCNRTPLRVIAARYDVSKSALDRHRRLHLDAATRAALTIGKPPEDIDLQRLAVETDSNLLSHGVSSLARLHQYIDVLIGLGDYPTAIRAETSIHRALEFLAKLRGLIVQQHKHEHVSLLVSEDWVRARSAIVTALQPYPDAARAVGVALRQLEAEAVEPLVDSKLITAPAVEVAP